MKTNSDFPQFASLAKLLHFPKDSHQKKFFLAKIEGFVDQLVRFLDNVDGRVTAGTSVKFLERVVIVLGLVLESVESRGIEKLYSERKETELRFSAFNSPMRKP